MLIEYICVHCLKKSKISFGESWWNIDLPIISVENDLSHSWEKLGDTEFYICAKCGLTKTKCSVSSCDNGIGENINCSEMVIRNIIK